MRGCTSDTSNSCFFHPSLGDRHLPRRGVQNWPYSEQGRVLPDTSSGGPLVNPYEWRNMQRCMPWRWEATRQRPVDVMWCLYACFQEISWFFQGLWWHHLAEILWNSNFVKNRWVILHSWTWHDLIKSFYVLLLYSTRFIHLHTVAEFCLEIVLGLTLALAKTLLKGTLQIAFYIMTVLNFMMILDPHV